MSANLKLSQKLTIKPGMRLITKIRMASFIQLGERKFSEYVIEVENDPVFKKLLSSEDAERRVITCKKFPKTTFGVGDLSFQEEISKDGASLDVETLLAGKNNSVALIKKIGLEKFEKYFLSGDEPGTVTEICSQCGISPNDAASIVDLINDLSIRAEFYHPSDLVLGGRITYAKIAEIVYDGKEDFVINYFSPKYISGRYLINSARLSALKKKNYFTAEELSRISKLIDKIELINARKSTIYQILRKIVQMQKNYLYSGDDKFLVPYTQKKLSQDIRVDESVICRAIYGRSILTPHDIEKPLKYFFPKNKSIRKKLLEKIISSEPKKLTDRQIVQKLKNEFSIVVSRRTVNAYRNELNKTKGA